MIYKAIRKRAGLNELIKLEITGPTDAEHVLNLDKEWGLENGLMPDELELFELQIRHAPKGFVTVRNVKTGRRRWKAISA